MAARSAGWEVDMCADISRSFQELYSCHIAITETWLCVCAHVCAWVMPSGKAAEGGTAVSALLMRGIKRYYGAERRLCQERWRNRGSCILSCVYTVDSSIRLPKEDELLYSTHKTDETRYAFQYAKTFLDPWLGGNYHVKLLSLMQAVHESCRPKSFIIAF